VIAAAPGGTDAYSFRTAAGVEIDLLLKLPGHRNPGRSRCQIGRELGVRAALEGSVRKEGKRIRATAQLIDLADGFHLWSETFDGELTDVFTIQEDITRAIVGALRVRLTPSGAASPGAEAAPTPEAYEWYLKGRFHYHQATPPSLQKSVECMNRAIACEPRYAAAYAGLADACVTWMGLAVERPLSELLDEARRAAATALEIDPRSAEAHCALGEVSAVADWDFAAAARRFEQSLALKPSFVHARMAYSVTCLAPLRRHEEAVAQLRRALNSDPMSVLWRIELHRASRVRVRPPGQAREGSTSAARTAAEIVGAICRRGRHL